MRVIEGGSPHMDLFRELTDKQIQSITATGHYMTYQPGQVVFEEGQPADGLYIVLSGRVEIYRVDKYDGEYILAKIGPNQVFGEIGFFMEDRKRTASARAAVETRLLYLPRNPADLLREMRDLSAAMKLLQNVICVLGERLQVVDQRKFTEDTVYVAPEKALEPIERQLPSGLLKKFFVRKKLKPDEMLCWEGDESDGFYFIHSGELEVLKLDPHRKFKKLGVMKAPTVAGELGYFTGELRAACLRALTPVDYTVFSGRDFEKLQKDQPLEALKILYAAAQLVANLIVSE
ncbi:MAG: hypothetical protein Kow0059_20180 [Candidatus Sumerlaeia bacterium]